MPEMSLGQLTRLFQLASLGKLIGGIIHNLNGPLQNLSLDLEMAIHSLKKTDNRPGDEIIQDMQSRIKRMEKELDQIDSLIKASSKKITQREEDNSEFYQINNYLQQELYFLETNLYFKHNVKTELDLQEAPPIVHNLTMDSLTALSWFLQALIEELEKESLKDLTLKTTFDNSTLRIEITTPRRNLSESFLSLLNQVESTSFDLLSEEVDMGIFLVMEIFRKEGISLQSIIEPQGSRIIITFPSQ